MNIIECLDGENDKRSSHSKADFEIQDNVNNKFDVSIEEIEQKKNREDIEDTAELDRWLKNANKRNKNK